MVSGYASAAYAASLAEFGEPLHLPRCGGYLLKRPIPGTDAFDAMGCYPLFFCDDWSGLADDLAALPADIVSVGLVAEPFAPCTHEQLDACFDVVNPYKLHYVVDLTQSRDGIGSRRHRKATRAALNKMQVEVCKDPPGFVEEWTRLYTTLVTRHDIRGIRAFSKRAFEALLRMPELVVHQAFMDSELAGAQLFFVQDGVAHCHLGAVNDAGYAAGAFYAMDEFAIGYFASRARWLDLGGGAGLSVDGNDGLSRYKRGWSSDTRSVHFCGRIIDPERYTMLARASGHEASGYFPAYRDGEFG